MILLYSNHTDSDILLKSELNQIAATNSHVKVHYTLTNEAINRDELTVIKGQNVTMHSGRITRSQIEQYFPPPGDDILLYVCGPPSFMDAYSGNKLPDGSQGELAGLLLEMGYTTSMVYKF